MGKQQACRSRAHNSHLRPQTQLILRVKLGAHSTCKFPTRQSNLAADQPAPNRRRGLAQPRGSHGRLPNGGTVLECSNVDDGSADWGGWISNASGRASPLAMGEVWCHTSENSTAGS